MIFSTTFLSIVDYGRNLCIMNQEKQVLETWMSVIGVSMALAGVPQIVKLLKRKKSDDLSLMLWWIILHGQVWWLIYESVDLVSF